MLFAYWRTWQRKCDEIVLIQHSHKLACAALQNLVCWCACACQQGLKNADCNKRYSIFELYETFL